MQVQYAFAVGCICSPCLINSSLLRQESCLRLDLHFSKMFSSSPIWSLPVLVLVLGTFLSSSLGHTTEQRLDLHQRLRDDARNTLRTYDFNRDGVLDQSEFSAFYLSFFSLGQKRFVAPRTVAKLFDSLDIDGDGQLSSEEFRKIFKHWVLPLISTKSCLFLCLPLNATSRTEMVQQTTTLIRQTQSLFPIHYVYLSSCTDPSVYFFFTDEAIAYLVSHIKGLLAKAHDIKLYDADNHRVSLKNKGT